MLDVWVVCTNIGLHTVVPAFNMIVGTWKTYSVVDTPHVMGERWWTAARALLLTDVGVLEIVCNRLGFLWHRVSQLLKQFADVIYWYKGKSRHHVYLDAQVYALIWYSCYIQCLDLVVDGLKIDGKSSL